MKPAEDPLGEARRFLAEIEAETRKAERELHQMLTEGADHFHRQCQAELEGLNETTLDAWTQEQQALSALREAKDPFGQRNRPSPKSTGEESHVREAHP